MPFVPRYVSCCHPGGLTYKFLLYCFFRLQGWLVPLPRIPPSALHRVCSSHSDRCNYVLSRDPHNIRKLSPSCFRWFLLLLSHSQATAYTCADQGRHRADSTLLEIAEPLLCVAFSSLTCCSAHVGIFRTSNPVS